MKRAIEYDLVVGNPDLPAVDCKTFEPGRQSVYFAMLALGGHLGSPEEAYSTVVEAVRDDSEYSEIADDAEDSGRIEPSLFSAETTN